MAGPGGELLHNGFHVRTPVLFSSFLRVALAQAISLTDALRPHGRLNPQPARRAGIARDARQRFAVRGREHKPNEINRIDGICC